jgi:tetratricopeptide (TPR) repeat protein
MNLRLTTALIVLSLPAFTFPAASAEPAPISDQARCAAIIVSEPVRFDGRVLEELPDIEEPELRLANQLLSSDCHHLSDDIFERFSREHPGNVHGIYYVARRAWMSGSPDMAWILLTDVLKRSPKFASARVLLAGLEYSRENYDEVKRLLDEAERSSPNDTWIYLNRARLAADQNPPPELKSRMREMASNPAFPPNVRSTAADIGAGLGDREDFLRINAGIRTPFTPNEIANLAHLLHNEGRHGEVRKLLESPATCAGVCLRSKDNRVMLAVAYLLEAAAVDPQPSSANAPWVAKADAVLMKGDYTELIDALSGSPDARKLRPFLRKGHPDYK